MIKGFQGVTLVDFPGKVASIAFLGGCNLRCPYCYNVDLVVPERLKLLPSIPEEKVITELQRREKFVQGLVITGGEPLIHCERLFDFIGEVKEKTELAIKLDSNGQLPEPFKYAVLLLEPRKDYIAIDVKTVPEKYKYVAGEFDRVVECVEATIRAKVDFELRITMVPNIIDPSDVYRLGMILKYEFGSRIPKIALQKFVTGVPLLNKEYESVPPYPPSVLEDAKRTLNKILPETTVVVRR